MYQQLSHGEGVGRCDWLLVRVVSTFADMMPTRGSAAPLPQPSVGRAAIALTTPAAASKPLTPITNCCAHCRHRLRCPEPSGQSSGGVTQTSPSATHPVHLWLAGPDSLLARGPWRRRNGSIQCCWPDGTASSPLPRSAVAVVIARTGGQTMQRSIPKRPARPTLRTKSHPTCSRCGVIELRGYVGVSSGQATVGTGLP